MRNDRREIQHFNEDFRMASVYSNANRGRDFARYALALARGADDLPSAWGFSKAQFGEHSAVTTVLRAAMTSGTTVDGSWAGSLSEYTTMQTEFLELVRPRTVIGQLALRDVPLGVRVLRDAGTAVGYWVGEAAPKPLTSSNFDSVTLPARKIVAQAVLTKETINAPLSQAEAQVSKALVRAAAQVANDAFLSDAAEVGGISPPGLLAGVTPIASTGDALQDLALLIEAFGGDFDSAAWIMRPSTAVQLHLVGARSSSSTFADLSAKGGSLFGLPCVTSTGVPQDSSGGYIILLDTQAILLGSGGVEIRSGRHASLEMLTNPTNNSAVPVATTHVSMWQTDSVAIKVQRTINWTVANTDSVVALTGVNYASAST